MERVCRRAQRDLAMHNDDRASSGAHGTDRLCSRAQTLHVVRGSSECVLAFLDEDHRAWNVRHLAVSPCAAQSPDTRWRSRSLQRARAERAVPLTSACSSIAPEKVFGRERSGSREKTCEHGKRVNENPERTRHAFRTSRYTTVSNAHAFPTGCTKILHFPTKGLPCTRAGRVPHCTCRTGCVHIV